MSRGPTALSSKAKAADLDSECSFLPPGLNLPPLTATERPEHHPYANPFQPTSRHCLCFSWHLPPLLHTSTGLLVNVTDHCLAPSALMNFNTRSQLFITEAPLLLHEINLIKLTWPTRCWNCGPLGSSRSMSVWRANSLSAFQGGWYPWMSTGFSGPIGDSWRTAIVIGQIKTWKKSERALKVSFQMWKSSCHLEKSPP